MTELVKVFSSKITVFQLKCKYDRAQISVDDRPGNYSLTINSSFGNYTYSWFDIGVNFYEFLNSMDLGYLAIKMGAVDSELDVEKTVEVLQSEIKLMLKDECISKESAEEALESLEWVEDEHDFVQWLRETDIDDAWEYRVMRPGQKFREFEGFFNTFWEEFLKALADHDSLRLVKVKSKEERDGVTVTTYSLNGGPWLPERSEGSEVSSVPEEPKMGLGSRLRASLKGFLSKHQGWDPSSDTKDVVESNASEIADRLSKGERNFFVSHEGGRYQVVEVKN